MKTWIRWAVINGLPGVVLRAQARRGNPLAQYLTDPAAREDPYPFGDRIRARGRLVAIPYSYVTADYELCRTVLRHKDFGVTPPEAFTVFKPVQRLIKATDLKIASPVEPPAMLMVDPPVHTRYRKLVAQAFTPRAVARLRDRISEVTTDLLDDLAQHENADLIEQFALLLPIAIISEILGIPAEKRDDLLDAGHAGSPLLDIGISWKTFRTANDALREAQDYLVEHIAELRANPGDNILSDLATGGELTDTELLYSAALIAGAGFETTVNLIGNGIMALHQHPEQLDLLRAEPARWPGAVEEILRYDSPVQMTARTALRDIEIAGVRIAKGEMVALLLGCANRDPKMFDNPNVFDVTRANAREHLSFSSGVHACLGASLARMEGAVALQALYDRFPNLRVADAPQRRGLLNLRGFQHIPVSTGVGARVAAG
ncbi:cytochrome P450 [Nocardia sp. XZ_19_385]|uniref:cytochrome P450 n=1 Tax=Nocardia sp. XZ_19_385 TaxID=2769488 RepID=UPI00188E200C|nr:cytochrome P450 [Nocardia sp. XZ_19_385]